MRSLTDIAGNLEVSVEQVLIALRIVATRAGVDELAEWAARELEGYGEKDKLPAHRTWELTIFATLHNPWQGSMSRVQVPIKKELREKATIYNCRSGIGEIEHSLTGNADPAAVSAVEHPNLAQIVGASLQHPWTCVQATAEFSPLHLKAIVDKARQTALKLCLECEKNDVTLMYFGDDDDSTGSNRERDEWVDLVRKEGAVTIIREAFRTAMRYLGELNGA